MLLSILHICYGGWEAHPKFDMLLLGAKFFKQHSADQKGKITEEMTAAGTNPL